MPKIEMQALEDQLVDGGGRRASGPKGVEGKEGYTPGTKFFAYTEEEANALVERKLADRISPASPAEGEEPTDDTPPATDAPWTLQMEPDAYLAKYGEEKQWSALAKAELARRAAAAEKK